MAITITLYSFGKRENSTKQPASGGTAYSCTLIDDTSLMNPTFKMEISSNPIGKNYAYVADFNRYYFITDITSSKGFWYISCKCDVLATYKSTIGAESHYVLRSASSWDGSIIDTAYITKSGTYGLKNGYKYSDPIAWTNGHSYVVGIIGYADDASDMIGSVTYYHMNETTLKGFVYFLMHQVEDWSDIPTSEYDPSVQQALLNPIQYIVSCMVLPIAPPSGVNVSHIWFGYYDCNVNDISGAAIDTLPAGSVVSESFSCDVPKHPQAATRGKYLNGEPYSSYTLHFGPLGDIPIDAGQLIDATTITADILTDKVQGTARLIVYPTGDSSNVLFCGTWQEGAEINLSQVLKNPLDRATAVTSGALSTAAGFLTLNIPNTLNSFYNTFDSATRTKMQQLTPGAGSTGSLLQYFDSQNIYLAMRYQELVDENLTEIGRPLCKTKVINTLSGFIVCDKADCIINGTSEEADQINAYLNGGFFYE